MRIVVALVVLIGIFVCLFVSLSGSDDPVATPTAQPLNEAVTGAAEETLETAEEGQSALCTACLIANGGDCSQCSGVCVCPSE